MREFKLKSLKLPTPTLKYISDLWGWGCMVENQCHLKNLQDAGVVIQIVFSFSFPVGPMQRPWILEGLLKTQPESAPSCSHCARCSIFLKQVNIASDMWYVASNWAYMFFSILIGEEDQKQLAFTRSKQHYNYNLVQNYVKSPSTGNNIFQWYPDDLSIAEWITLIHYIHNIMLTGLESEKSSMLEALVRLMHSRR